MARHRPWLCAVAALTLAAGLLSLTAKNVIDFDTWHQMAAARDLLAGRLSTDADPYAFSETVHPITHHEWGVGLIAYALASQFGMGALLAMKYSLLAGAVLLCFLNASTTAGPWEDWALLAIPAIPLIAVGFMTALRPQMFSFFFVALLLFMLRLADQGRRWWIALWLLLFPLWVNLHAGCLIGIVLLGAAAGERMLSRKPFWHLAGVAAAMVALMSLSPSGLAYYQFLWRSLPRSRPNISEWDGLWKTLPALAAFVVCILTFGIRVTEKGLRGIAGWGILLVTAVIAFRAVKMAPLFGLAWMSYAPAFLSGTNLRSDLEKQNRVAPWRPIACWLALFGIFAFIGVGGVWRARVPGRSIPAFGIPPYPVGAVDYLEERQFSGNILAPFEFGAYVSWKMGTAVKVFIDSRYDEVYPVETLEQEVQFYTGQPNWREMLTRQPLDAAVIPNATAVAALMPESGWNLAYTDPEYRVYLRPGLTLPPMNRETAPDGTLP